MNPTLIGIIVLAVALLVIGGLWLASRKKKSETLEKRFGPEYERTVRETGKRTTAEKDLEQRAERVEKLHIRELTPDEQARFSQSWKKVQTRFVDEPAAAIGEADGLVQEAMNTRGYPVGDFDQQAADISVNHPDVVTHYRAGHEIAQKHANKSVGTEELRQAMLHYRALFDELLGPVSANNSHREGSKV